MKDLSLPKPVLRNNNPILPKSIRGCIIGKSGCGKTNLLMNLLLDKFDNIDYLDYDNLYIFSRSLHQPEYTYLINCFMNNLSKEEILQKFESKDLEIKGNSTKKPKVSVFYYDDSAVIPDPSELNPNEKHLIIFDDIMLEKQNKIEDYYTRGRHNNVDCFYISQNYIKLPRQTIRENANLFIFFPQDNITLDHFYRDHCTDIDKESFNYLTTATFDQPFNFITVDLSSHKDKGKFRRNLFDFLVQ